MNPHNLEKTKAEVREFKIGRTTTLIEILLTEVFSTIVQSQIIYNQEKTRNVEAANAALRTGQSLQTLFRINTEIYKTLEASWEFPESELLKLLEMTRL